MTMGNRIAVMNAGRIQQVGTPLEVYDHPANVFVAQFIGTPPMNFFDATVQDGRLHASTFALPLPAKYRAAARDGQKVRVGMRPENILQADEQGRGETARIPAVVEIVEPIGYQAIVHTRAGEDLLVASFDAHHMPAIGSPIELVVELDALHLFDASSEARL
ncbi:MAG: multiple sugar transport system ATP-binding protein [Acidobacteriota bacterium]|nr:multiple sugar transport system ATP-binding protein [Acidobacteriota bacterium]